MEKTFDLCQCEETDWECDFGFHKPKGSKTCEPVDPHYEIKDTRPEPCHGWYNVETGYRKIPGNSCQGGKNINNY